MGVLDEFKNTHKKKSKDNLNNDINQLSNELFNSASQNLFKNILKSNKTYHARQTVQIKVEHINEIKKKIENYKTDDNSKKPTLQAVIDDILETAIKLI